MNRTAYNILFTLVLPIIVLRLLWRSIKAPAYARRWAERFGILAARKEHEGCIWIHAVSMGESIAAAPLVKKLRAEKPNLPVVVTTMTPTGSAQVKAMFADDVAHVYAPYDHPWFVKRFLRAFKPQILVIMETELWPNIIHYTKMSGAKVLVANARLSEKSARGYEKFPRLGQPMLQQLDCIAVQASNDAQRFSRLGVQEDKLSITGSIKFEIDIDTQVSEKAQQLKALIEDVRPVLVAASTREGEEEKVLSAFKKCLAEIPDLLLILVPRHPERFSEVAKLCAARGLTMTRRTQGKQVDALCNVFLGDSMGEMLSYLSIADIAFVGGSLVDTGCHNVLEPAALGLPVLVGPSQFNFQTICEQLQEVGALVTVSDENVLAKEIVDIFSDSTRRKAMGEAGKKLIAENRGALQRTFDIVVRNIQQA
ncbi:MAG: lipid IV(A) 3-deoxy-D-manno-octulosonic acid transferase [Pseudohongiellaceae bacterium]|nr:lipid IV(A) 3-deoxy-D-manno-octulosonic acid transferase [Pseudohongiellaceae bacterium]